MRECEEDVPLVVTVIEAFFYRILVVGCKKRRGRRRGRAAGRGGRRQRQNHNNHSPAPYHIPSAIPNRNHERRKELGFT